MTAMWAWSWPFSTGWMLSATPYWYEGSNVFLLHRMPWSLVVGYSVGHNVQSLTLVPVSPMPLDCIGIVARKQYIGVWRLPSVLQVFKEARLAFFLWGSKTQCRCLATSVALYLWTWLSSCGWVIAWVHFLSLQNRHNMEKSFLVICRPLPVNIYVGMSDSRTQLVLENRCYRYGCSLCAGYSACELRVTSPTF